MNSPGSSECSFPAETHILSTKNLPIEVCRGDLWKDLESFGRPCLIGLTKHRSAVTPLAAMPSSILILLATPLARHLRVTMVFLT